MILVGIVGAGHVRALYQRHELLKTPLHVLHLELGARPEFMLIDRQQRPYPPHQQGNRQ